ncbi:MAG: hypothetical protein IJ223_02235 [Clostridia bacterium]|nr:hypothetical protein [Clostridia bacterium]
MSRNKILIPIIILTAIIILIIIILNPSTRFNKISISETKWNNIISSRTENKNLILRDLEFNDYNLVIDEKNNTVYYSLINDNKTKYNPIVSFKSKNQNIKIAILSDEITDNKVQNNYKFKIMIYNDKEYHIYNLVCTELPIVNIRYKEKVGIKQKNIPMEIYVFNNLSNTPNRIAISNGKIKIDENNYIFSLNMTTPGKNIRENRISILNMKPNSEYILKPVDSQEENVAGQPKNHRVELFINNEYQGVYSLEYIEREFGK